MGLVSPEDRRSRAICTRPITRGRIQLGRADVRDDTTLAKALSFLSHTNIFSQSRPMPTLDYIENFSLEGNLP